MNITEWATIIVAVGSGIGGYVLGLEGRLSKLEARIEYIYQFVKGNENGNTQKTKSA